MAATQKRTLFNDPTLSDIKIKQISDGKTCEYFGHKAILCAQSDFFMKAFTGRFKEATDTFIEIHDDDPEHFEFALKFMYTQKYNTCAIETAIGNSDKVKRAQFSMGVHVIADKYDMQHLIMPAKNDLQDIFKEMTRPDDLTALITAQYSNCNVPGNWCALRIVSTLFQSHQQFATSDQFAKLCQDYPAFASDTISIW